MDQVAHLKSWDKYKVNSKHKLLLNETLRFSIQRSSSNAHALQHYKAEYMQLYAALQQKLKAPQLIVSFINILLCIFNRVIAASKFNSEWAQGFWRHHNTNWNNSYSEQKTSRNTYLIPGSKKSWIILKSFFNQLAKSIK